MNTLDTISATPHKEIMDHPDYFDICKRLTAEHQASGRPFVLPERLKFNTNLAFEPEDLGFNYKRKFFINRDGVDEYTAEQQAVPGVLECTYLETSGKIMQSLKQLIGFKHMFATLNHQEPGHVVGVHCDHFRTLVKVKAAEGETLYPHEIHRFVVFIDDQQIGHSFMVGLESINWRAGDVVEFPWYALHATANAGLTTKRLISVAGVY